MSNCSGGTKCTCANNHLDEMHPGYMKTNKKPVDDEKDDHILIKVVKEDAIEEPPCQEKEFVRDQRETNPRLHMLYTKWAIGHLVVIDEFHRKLHNFANMNMLDLCEVIQKERYKLTTENAAYAEAEEIIKLIEKHKTQNNQE